MISVLGIEYDNILHLVLVLLEHLHLHSLIEVRHNLHFLTIEPLLIEFLLADFFHSLEHGLLLAESAEHQSHDEEHEHEDNVGRL